MLLELIAPASEDSTFLPRMGLGVLMARTPRDVGVVYTDEVVKPFDISADLKPVDLVGISVDSKTARRSYDIADAYRAQGVSVVLGGIHPSACPAEAKEHADAVVVGEADVVWPRVVADFRQGRPEAFYRPELPDLKDMPEPRRDLFTSKKYIPFQVVQTMRGCPYPCEFCSVSTANGKTFRFRPIDHVISELCSLDKLIMFADDNVMIHRGYSAELFRRMAPLGKHWIGQCSLATVRKIENVELMAKSGCKALFIGFESIDDDTVRHTGKRQNRPSQYRAGGRRCFTTTGSAAGGQLRLRLRHRQAERLRADGGGGHRDEAHHGLLRHPHPLPRHPTLPTSAAQEGRLTDPRVVAPQHDHDEGSPYYVPRQMTREHATRGLGEGLDSTSTRCSARCGRRYTVRKARLELDPGPGLLADQRDAKPARPVGRSRAVSPAPPHRSVVTPTCQRWPGSSRSVPSETSTPTGHRPPFRCRRPWGRAELRGRHGPCACRSCAERRPGPRPPGLLQGRRCRRASLPGSPLPSVFRYQLSLPPSPSTGSHHTSTFEKPAVERACSLHLGDGPEAPIVGEGLRPSAIRRGSRSGCGRGSRCVIGL